MRSRVRYTGVGSMRSRVGVRAGVRVRYPGVGSFRSRVRVRVRTIF